MKRILPILWLVLQASVGHSQGNIDSLKNELAKLNRITESRVPDSLRFELLRAITKAYFDINSDSSTLYNGRMIELSKSPGMQKELAQSYQYAGYIHQIRGDFHQSIRFHYKALSLAEKLNEVQMAASSLGWLAHAYSSLREYAKAVQLCEQGLAVLRKSPNSYTQCSILNVLGAIYREQGKLAEALRVNRTLYGIAKAGHHQWYEAQGLHAIGWVYTAMGNFEQSLEYFNRALELAIKLNSVDLEVSILLNIGNLYVRQKKWDLAMQYCNRAKASARAVKNSSLFLEAEEMRYKIFRQTGQLEKALRAYESFVSLRDSLSKEKNEHRIEILQAQYDNVQKSNDLQRQKVELLVERNQNQMLAQTRNVLYLGIVAMLLTAGLLVWNNRRLQVKNFEINRQRMLLDNARNQLEEANKTLEIRVDERTQELLKKNEELIRKNEEIKEALFKGQTIERKRVAVELHDNLSSLLSAVNMSMQSINADNLSEREQLVYRNVRQLVQNAYSEVRNISHNIFPAELDHDGLAKTLETLIRKFNQNFRQEFTLRMTGLGERLPVEIEFNVYSIVLELTNNAIRHAQADVVTISLTRTDVGIDIIVTDDGVGMPVVEETKRGVGLQNIKTRLDSLGGTFQLMVPEGRGAKIGIRIPIEESFSMGIPM